VATLANIRAALNAELGVVTDGDTVPWTQAARNQAIADGYADLWRVGVWKDAKQDLATVTSQHIYALTAIRRLGTLELLDSSARLLGKPKGVVEPDGSGAYQLRLKASIDAGTTLRVRGWGTFVSVFVNDAAVDDLPTEYGRIPRLKAKAILYRQQLGSFARYSERQNMPPTMNVTIEQFLGIIAAAEREYAEACKALSNLRQRYGQPVGLG
jgi:hypothetical protein